jgi:hypothetical protein
MCPAAPLVGDGLPKGPEGHAELALGAAGGEVLPAAFEQDAGCPRG